ncbi:hypothetical protein EV175_006556, partial [Coemansia sp. RSA 1933]
VVRDVWSTLTDFYSNTKTPSSQLEPLHRKLRLNAYIGQQRADEQLCKELREKFAKDGVDPVLIMGNWGASMSKYHAPIKGVGMRRMLRRHRFEMFLINEHNTSSICPACCTEVLQNPNELVQDPRPWQRLHNPRVKRHGLLVCTNPECVAAIDSDSCSNNRPDSDFDDSSYITTKTGRKRKRSGNRESDIDSSNSNSNSNKPKARFFNRDVAAVLNF